VKPSDKFDIDQKKEKGFAGTVHIANLTDAPSASNPVPSRLFRQPPAGQPIRAARMYYYVAAASSSM
jgi:hypothetical protein